MSKLYICTVGTSISKRISKDPSLKSKLDSPDFSEDDAKKLRLELGGAIRTIPYKTDKKERRNLSAEINALDRDGICSDDSVVLLASDTHSGFACAEKLCELLIDCYGIDRTKARAIRVDGLQTDDAKRLREVGLKELINLTEKYIGIGDSFAQEVVLNPTGGFKCVVPFLAMLGMLHRKSSIYVFEKSNELLRLPPMPFVVDNELFDRMRDALYYLDEEIEAPENVFLDKIDGYTEEERDLFLSFTERSEDKPNYVTLSPLFFSIVELEKQGTKFPSLISASAIENLRNIRGDSLKNLAGAIKRSNEPLWRARHKHGTFGKKSNLFVFKPGNTAERIVGWEEDGRVKIVLVYDNHDEYERGYDCDHCRVDFAQEEFVEWSPELVGLPKES